MAEELWARLGEAGSLAFTDFPEPDPALLVDDTVEVPVQINGKVRGKVTVATGASEADHEAAARADARIAELLAGATVRKVVVVPGRMVNFVARLTGSGSIRELTPVVLVPSPLRQVHPHGGTGSGSLGSSFARGARRAHRRRTCGGPARGRGGEVVAGAQRQGPHPRHHAVVG